MKFTLIITITNLMISLLGCSPLNMSTKSIAFSSENNKLVFSRTNQAQAIFDIIIDMLTLFEDARKNRIYIPLDELKEFNVSEDEILKFHESINLSKLLMHQILRAEVFYKNAYQKLPKEDLNQQIPGLLMGKIYETLLLEIKRDKPEQTLNRKVLLPPLRKILVILSCFFKNKLYALKCLTFFP